jgi:fructose-1,6-bisphosphatase II
METHARPGQQEAPDRNLALELVRVTEAGALAAARLVGMGDKIAADQAAVDAMRVVLDTVQMDGVVVIGEGEKDEAPMLYNGEHIGDGSAPEVDIAVDPLEGTTLTAKGMPSALSVIALSPARDDVRPGPVRLHAEARGRPGHRRPARPGPPDRETIGLVAERKELDVRDVMVVVLDRPATTTGIAEIREAGARVRLISDGDVSAAMLAASRDTPVDLLWGIGGTPEGVIAAAALKCIGGGLVGRLWPRDEDERRARRTRATTWTASSPRTTSSAATTASSRPRASRTATSCRACATRPRRREHGVARDALADGHGRRITARHNRDKLRLYTGPKYG